MKLNDLIAKITFIILILNINVKSNYCSAETCRRCCQVAPTGCVNSMNTSIRGRYISFLSFCRDCDCDDPNSGCGWKASNFGRVECTSCDNLKSINYNNNIAMAGCGHVTFNGDIVYTALPSPIFAP